MVFGILWPTYKYIFFNQKEYLILTILLILHPHIILKYFSVLNQRYIIVASSLMRDVSLFSHDPVCKPCRCAAWHPRKTASQPFQPICKFYQQKSSNITVLRTAIGSSQWLRRQTCSLYLHRVAPALGCSKYISVLHKFVAKSDLGFKIFPQSKPGSSLFPVLSRGVGLVFQDVST